MTPNRCRPPEIQHAVSAFLTACFPTEPLSRFDHFVHRDLDAVEDHLNNVIIPHRLTSAATTPLGSFRHGGVDFGSFNLSSVRYNFDGGELSVACPVMDDDYRIQVTVAGTAGKRQHSRNRGSAERDPG